MEAKTYDVGDDELETMDRTALLEVVSRDIVSRMGATSRRRSEKSDQVREMEMQLELKKIKLKQRRIDAETVNKRMETENRRMEIQAETRTRDLQNEQERREHELKMAEAGRPAEGDEPGGYDDQNVDEDGAERGCPRLEPRRPRVETLADRVKRYGSALKQVVSPMPSDATEIPQFFESL